MRSIGRLGILLLGLLIGGLAGQVCVMGADKKEEILSDKVLNADIVRSDGVNITPQNDEIVYTNTALTYTLNQSAMPELYKYALFSDERNKKVDELLSYRVVLQYAVSTDKGDVYSGWSDLAGNTFTLIPGAIGDGMYMLKFRKVMEYSVKTAESVLGSPGESVSENQLYEKNKKEYEAYKRGADAVAAKEPLHVVESGIYRVILDTMPPHVEFTPDRDMEAWTNGSIKCRVRVNDTMSKPARLKVTCDDTSVAEENYDKNASMSGSEKEFVISNESSGDNGSELIIEASDNAGNVNILKMPVRIDKTAPDIDLEGVDNLGRYKTPMQALVTGEDLHPDKVCVEYVVKRTYDGNEEEAESGVKTLTQLREEPLYTASADGDYMIVLRARDSAGNESAPIRRNFRIDALGPGVNFTGINDGAVINRDVELKVNAFDNFENDYRVNLTGSVTGNTGTRDVKLADYRTDGKYSVNTYYFKEDGEYTISSHVEDAAGNVSDETISFAVDKVAPSVEIMGGINLKEDMVTNVAPEINFKIKEANYETAAVVCDLYRINDQKQRELVKNPEWVMNEETSKFSITIEEEGSYELSVTAADAAGNTSGKTIKFTLDMTKPEIDYVEELDKKYIKSFKLPDNFSEYIKDRSGVNYKTYINSQNYDEGREIDEDGKYVLKVSAVDDAGNQAEKTVEFIVDSTQPRVVIDGMADDGSVNKDDTIVLSLYDGDDYFRSVRLNGQEMVTEEKQNTVEFTIPEYGDYSIDVEAVDLAQNVLTQSIEAKCANARPVSEGTSTVRTLQKSEKTGRNKGLRIFLIILTVLVLGGSVALYCVYSIKQERMYQ